MLLHLFLLCSLLLLRRFCVCLGTICFNNRIFFCCCLCCIGFTLCVCLLLFLLFSASAIAFFFIRYYAVSVRFYIRFFSDYPVRHMLLLLLLLLVVIVVFVFISSLASAQPVTLSPSTRDSFFDYYV